MNKSLKSDLIKEALERFPSTPTLTIAKKLYKENPLLFTTAEEARSSIRYYRGAQGGQNKKCLQDRSFLGQKYSSLNRLPEPLTYMKDWEPYLIPSSKILVLCDLQIPFYDMKAVMLAIKAGQEAKCDCVLLNGDLMDFFALSFFEKNPKERDFPMEVDAGAEFLSILREEFPKAKIIWKLGNHEERLERYLAVKAPELFDLPHISLESLFETDKLDVDVVRDKRVLRIGHLSVLHGHEFGKSIIAPVNPARGAYLRCKENVVIAHHHQTSEHTENSLNGTVTSAWSIGCLCDLHPRYLPINKWNHGFAIVEQFKNGQFQLSNRKIIGGKVY